MSSTLDTVKFSDWLKEVIAAKNLSYRDVEKKSKNEISRSYISLLIKGKSLPGDLSLKKVIALSLGLEVSVRDVLEKALGAELEKFSTVKLTSFDDFDEVIKEYAKNLELDTKRKSA